MRFMFFLQRLPFECIATPLKSFIVSLRKEIAFLNGFVILNAVYRQIKFNVLHGYVVFLHHHAAEITSINAYFHVS